METQAARLGYGFRVFHRSDFKSAAALQAALRNRGITDIILGPVLQDALKVDLDWDSFISIQMLPSYVELPFHSVVKDHFGNVVLAWKEAVRHGYRRVGIVLFDHPFELKDDLFRLSAVYACQTHLFPRMPVVPAFRYNPANFPKKEFQKWISPPQTGRADRIFLLPSAILSRGAGDRASPSPACTRPRIRRSPASSTRWRIARARRSTFCTIAGAPTSGAFPRSASTMSSSRNGSKASRCRCNTKRRHAQASFKTRPRSRRNPATIQVASMARSQKRFVKVVRQAEAGQPIMRAVMERDGGVAARAPRSRAA